MRWLDLGSKASLTLRAGSGAPQVQLSSNEPLEDADQLGFVPDGPQRWVRQDPLLNAEFWAGLMRRFPQAQIVDREIDDIFDRAPAANEAPSRQSLTPRQVSYRKVGEHRGKKRLWLEGLRLGECGFEPGANYSVVFDASARTIALVLDPDGDRTVSRRRRPNGSDLPIVDLCDANVELVVGNAARMRALMEEGRIEFSLHPVDQAIAARESRLRTNLEAGFITEGVLCAGGGVSALAVKEGFAEAGLAMEIEWLIDRDSRYLEAARQSNPAVHPMASLIEGSLEEVEPGLLSPVDVVTVSLPCTGHSVAGKAKRGLAMAEDHPTDALAVYGMLKILEAVQPSVVISENVAEASNSATYALVRAYLHEQGYVMVERTLNGEDAGSIENRTRWWFVAISRGLADNLTLDDLPARPRVYPRLADALEPVPDDSPEWRRHDFLDRKEVRDAARGAGFARQLVTPDAEHIGTIGRGYAKRRSTEPFLVREDGMERLLTPVEHVRVKGAPASFEAMVQDLSITLAHEIMGQSILYHHATAISARVGAVLSRSVGLPVPPALDFESKPAPAVQGPTL